MKLDEEVRSEKDRIRKQRTGLPKSSRPSSASTRLPTPERRPSNRVPSIDEISPAMMKLKKKSSREVVSEWPGALDNPFVDSTADIVATLSSLSSESLQMVIRQLITSNPFQADVIKSVLSKF